jgi:aryl-alcohol dehydrogenase-like predicted oxidoreductase
MPYNVIPGFATPENTSHFRDRFPELASVFNRLGKTELLCSPVGFGSYRVDVRVAEHKAALIKAVRMGVNLIDSSANYANGNAERLIGEVLRTMISANEITRDEMIIVTKGGYIQGENYERISKSDEEIELVKYANGLWHSIHPDFLEDQITRSLERLELETIDVYLLHNPEYYMQWAIRDRMPEDEAREIYEARIQKAFAYLEEEVERGRIKWYGISSNTFPKPEFVIDRTALEKIYRSALSSLGENNHFAVIQLPMNLYERGGLLEKNQEKSSKSVIEYARENDLGVLINRPLNAFANNQLIRIADYPEREFPPVEEITDLVHDLKLQEEEFKNGSLKDISLDPQAYDAVKKLLAIGAALDGKWDKLASFDEWRDLLYTVLKPRLQYAFDLLQETAKANREIFIALQEYAESIDEVMEHISNFYTTMAFERSQNLHKKIDEALPDQYSELSLSQKAVLMLRSIDGVSSVLVGMRSDEYVDDVMYGLAAKRLEEAEKVWSRIELG